jgi:serine/threonine protein phosphatase PrpC
MKTEYSITGDSVIGGRYEQQDEFIIFSHGYQQVLAVMDGHGHGGKQVAIGIRDRVFKSVNEIKKSTTLQSLRKLICDLSHDIIDDSGSTLSIVVAQSKTALVGTIGDSPVLIKGRGGKLFVSEIHNARSNLAERVAAETRGERYVGGYMYSEGGEHGIQLTRAIGDTWAGFISYEPFMASVPLDKDSWALVCTDGLIDATQPWQSLPLALGWVIEQLDAGKEASELLVNRPAKSDNATAVVYHIKSEKE